ncbi:DUF1360 domain-containing protein [Nocardia sp. CS682]|uniref:DUF1360 domain-containing protein n=1 Tax=Nocardia sp. CS682 TaxID=1047172 RepID=UPI001074D9AE|nr:DUF1360 domain-containing protein [Nocardia sp. CS682]QBS39259.1 hypothetical protein DMB37_03115 [Nocardia sp. CS682]
MTENQRRLGGYTATMTLYAIIVAAVALLGRVTDRQLPRAMTARDLITTAAAAHKLSRTVTKAAVTRPVRAPFTEETDTGGPGEVMEQPKSDAGLQHSFGELLSCPFCFDVWAVTALTIGHVFAPRATRLVADGMAALAGADFLHLAYAKAQQLAEG